MNIEQKNNLLINIEYLSKVRRIKKADLEAAAGVSKGYLSRFKNDDPNSLPSVSFIESAASQLKVTIDALLNADLSDELAAYNVRLLKKLIKDTENHDLEWSMGDSDAKMKELKKSGKEDQYFTMKGIGIEVIDEVEPRYNEDGVKEGYIDSEGEFRDLSSLDYIDEDHLVFKPGVSADFMLWGDDCCQPFVDGKYYWTKLAENIRIFLIEMAAYQNGQPLEDGEWMQTTLWIAGEETDLLIEDGTSSQIVRRMLADLERTIVRSKRSISKMNQKALDNYLKTE